jgi:hypothetical protein
MKSSVKLPSKKIYQAPKLLKYGSLTEMTNANASQQGQMDGMTGPRKTG